MEKIGVVVDLLWRMQRHHYQQLDQEEDADGAVDDDDDHASSSSSPPSHQPLDDGRDDSFHFPVFFCVPAASWYERGRWRRGKWWLSWFMLFCEL